MNVSAYLGVAAATLLGWAAATVGLTILVDPYRTFGTPTIAGWTELKPRAFEQEAIAKTYQLERIKPRTLLLGNSRSEIGLDPTSSRFPSVQRPVFNASFAGGDVCMSLLMLRDAVAVRVPLNVILAVDFQDLLTVPGESIVPSVAEQRLLVANDGSSNRRRQAQLWKDRLSSTLTVDALADSIRTVLDQDPVRSGTITSLGFNPLHEYHEFARRSGYYTLFSAKLRAYHQQFAAYSTPDFARPRPIMIRRDTCLRSLIRTAGVNQIPLTLYIHPYHADFLEMLTEMRLWESFEDWKRRLAAELNEPRLGSARVRLFDFSGFNDYTTEPVPAPGDTISAMRWYWEPGHYKSALGERVLTALFDGDIGFGRILTVSNIEETLAEIRQEYQKFHGNEAMVPKTATHM
jgi:hypothetical protein